MDFFQAKEDNKQELLMLQAQADIQTKLGEQRLEATIIEGDLREIEAVHKEQASTIRKGSRWLANLSGSIRPIVTYLFVLEFLAISWSIAYLVLDRDGVTIEALESILSEDFMILFSSIMAFWFGNRTFGKRAL
jgi:hypothetical protein|tara:strand:+ start:895 stop:1296 length:402 start_codon:yes stop_codon:yes gene_type:complete